MKTLTNYVKNFLIKRLYNANIVLQVIRFDPNRFTNLRNLDKKRGKFICRNGFILKFDKTNVKHMRSCFTFLYLKVSCSLIKKVIGIIKII